MSAYICNPVHIATLAAYRCWADGSDPATATEDAEALARANIASVKARYPDVTGPEDWPGPLDYASEEAYLQDVRALAERLAADVATLDTPPIQILKMAECLDYQCCEVPDWPGSRPWYLLENIRGSAMRRLPGWASAPWHLEEEVTS